MEMNDETGEIEVIPLQQCRMDLHGLVLSCMFREVNVRFAGSIRLPLLPAFGSQRALLALAGSSLHIMATDWPNTYVEESGIASFLGRHYNDVAAVYGVSKHFFKSLFRLTIKKVKASYRCSFDVTMKCQDCLWNTEVQNNLCYHFRLLLSL